MDAPRFINRRQFYLYLDPCIFPFQLDLRPHIALVIETATRSKRIKEGLRKRNGDG